MYQINRYEKRITKLEAKRFAELGFTERSDLQEWLAHNPEALGEPLLIIQKEFDGFDDTRERLDLLALDKNRNLVVIENKLDDSGRDVVWQALKYASYCSSLTKSQVINIYQGYLERYCNGGDATSNLCDFLEVADLDEVVLNKGNDQRLIMVAAAFRKEVTSTALWLMSHGIRVQCFRVTPYQFGEQLFLNIDQVIPTPEASELMIGMNAKEADEKNTEFELQSRHKIRLAFWEEALEAMKASPTQLFANVSPSKDHWLNTGSGVTGCPFTMIFGKKVMRVQLDLNRHDKTENKYLFDQLYERQDQIEKAFGQSLEWLRLDDKKSSRVQLASSIDGYDRANWPEIVEWLVSHINALERALKTPLMQLNQSLKQSLIAGTGGSEGTEIENKSL